MDIITHEKIDQELVGRPISVEKGNSVVELITSDHMIADDKGLVHGGFVFGLADYAAMIAVNHPNVVLGSSSVNFLKPVRSNERLVAKASVLETKGKKRIVAVDVRRTDDIVLSGEFICFVLDKHVLD